MVEDRYANISDSLTSTSVLSFSSPKQQWPIWETADESSMSQVQLLDKGAQAPQVSISLYCEEEPVPDHPLQFTLHPRPLSRASLVCWV